MLSGVTFPILVFSRPAWARNKDNYNTFWKYLFSILLLLHWFFSYFQPVSHNYTVPNLCWYNYKRLHTLFGHVVRLDATTPAHQALEQVVATKAGHRPDTNWRRPPGRPRRTRIQQVGEGTPASWRQMWQSAEERGHRGESWQRTTAVYAWWWWWWIF